MRYSACWEGLFLCRRTQRSSVLCSQRTRGTRRGTSRTDGLGFLGQICDTTADKRFLWVLPGLRLDIDESRSRWGERIWDLRVCRSSDRGSGLPSRVVGTTTLIRTRLSTRCIFIYGSFYSASPSLSTW